MQRYSESLLLRECYRQMAEYERRAALHAALQATRSTSLRQRLGRALGAVARRLASDTTSDTTFDPATRAASDLVHYLPDPERTIR